MSHWAASLYLHHEKQELPRRAPCTRWWSCRRRDVDVVMVGIPPRQRFNYSGLSRRDAMESKSVVKIWTTCYWTVTKPSWRLIHVHLGGVPKIIIGKEEALLELQAIADEFPYGHGPTPTHQFLWHWSCRPPTFRSDTCKYRTKVRYIFEYNSDRTVQIILLKPAKTKPN
jgi:hypothetical protein